MSYTIKPNVKLGTGCVVVIKSFGKTIEIPCKNRTTAEYEAKRTIAVLRNVYIRS